VPVRLDGVVPELGHVDSIRDATIGDTLP
jgi:hypothetical protein